MKRWGMRGTWRANFRRRPQPSLRRASSSRAIALPDATLLIKLSQVEEKLGKYEEAQRWTEQARDVL